MLERGSYVEIHHRASKASLRLSVDARTGKLLLDSSDLREVTGNKKKSLLCIFVLVRM